MNAPFSGDFSRLWSLDPEVTFLNHGSFGACPLQVLQAQHCYREQMERNPVQFFIRDLGELLDRARTELAAFVGADPTALAFVPNATSGVNTVLRSLQLRPEDELLTTDHAYNACRNVLDYAAKCSGAHVVVAKVPFPIEGPGAVIEAVLDRVTSRTRIALLDHVTSPTGLVLPIAQLVKELDSRHVDVLVDGAHAPGMLPLDLSVLGAAYYTGNCHKWLCTPKGSAFLYVREDRQRDLVPLAISHGANSRRVDRSRFQLQFEVTHPTDDPTAYLCVPVAIQYLGSLLAGGWSELRQRNRSMAIAARRRLCEALEIPPPAPEEMLGSLASVPLPSPDGEPYPPSVQTDPVSDELMKRFRTEVPVMWWPKQPKRVLRVSAQLYNRPEQYESLAALLRGQLESLRR